MGQVLKGFLLTHRGRQVAVFVFLLAFLPRLSPALSTFYPIPDSFEYLNIARHVARGEGPLLSIKGRLLDQAPVIRSGACCRFLGFPLVAGGVLKIADSPQMVQLFNAVLTSAALALLFLVFDRLFDRRVALLAAILLSFHPQVFFLSIVVLTEPLFLFLISLLLLPVVTRREKGGVAYALAGLLLGLAVLVRPTAIILLPALVLYMLLVRKERGWPLKLGFLVGGLAAVLLPLLYYSADRLGDLPYSEYRLSFANADYAFIARRFFILLFYYLIALALYLFPFSLFLPQVVKRAVRVKYSPEALFLVLVSLFNLLLHAMLWGQPGPRYMLLSFLLLLPFCLEVLLTTKSQKVVMALIFLPLVPSLLVGPVFLHALALQKTDLVRFVHERVLRGGSIWSNRDLEGFVRWVKASTGENDIIGTFQFHSHIVNYYTGRPTITLPLPVDENLLRGFIVRYQVRHIIINADYDLRYTRTFKYGLLVGPPSPIANRKPVDDYLALLTRWKERGLVTLTRIGSYAVYSIVQEPPRRG